MRALEEKLTREEDREVVLRVLQLQERIKVSVDTAGREGQLAERYRSIENTVRVILDGVREIRASLEDVAHNLPVVASVVTTPGNHSKLWLRELAVACLDYHAEFLARLKPKVTEEAFVREMISLARTVLHDNPAKDGAADYLKAARKVGRQ